jgi:hypothetical protein
MLSDKGWNSGWTGMAAEKPAAGHGSPPVSADRKKGKNGHGVTTEPTATRGTRDNEDIDAVWHRRPRPVPPGD